MSPTPIKKSSRPLNWYVEAYPRGSLQCEHFLLKPSFPLYHLLTQASHPSRVEQHFVGITGGFIGVSWQILHVKA